MTPYSTTEDFYETEGYTQALPSRTLSMHYKWNCLWKTFLDSTCYR